MNHRPTLTSSAESETAFKACSSSCGDTALLLLPPLWQKECIFICKMTPVTVANCTKWYCLL